MYDRKEVEYPPKVFYINPETGKRTLATFEGYTLSGSGDPDLVSLRFPDGEVKIVSVNNIEQ